MQKDLNIYRPQASQEERRLKGIEKVKQYQIDNEDAIKAWQKEHYKNNQEKIKEYYNNNKEKMR